LQIVATDHIEDDIDTDPGLLTQRLHEIDFPVVNARVAPSASQAAHFSAEPAVT